MTIALPRHLAGAGEFVMQQGGRASSIAGLMVLSVVDRLPPVQRRYRLELEMRASAFAAGRAYEREVLGLPSLPTAMGNTGGVVRAAASGHSAGNARRSSARPQHLHLV